MTGETLQPTITDLDDTNTSSTVIPTTTSTDTQLVVAAPKPTTTVTVQQEKENPAAVDTNVFSHETVLKTAGGASGVGSAIGGAAGAIYAPKIAEQARDAVFNAVEKNTDQLSKDIAKATGLDKIPGGTLALANQGTDLAHAAGEATYQNVKQEMSVRGAALGGATAGALTIIVMEGVNLVSYGMHCYQQRQDRLKQEAETKRLEQRQSDLESGKLINLSDNQDDESCDFVVLDSEKSQTKTITNK